MEAAIVKILDLQVFLVEEDGAWFAQAVEIDYAACGSTESETRERFEDGICLTIRDHLDRFGHLDHLLKPAPSADWLDLTKKANPRRFTQISVHPIGALWQRVPFGQIKYNLMPIEAAA